MGAIRIDITRLHETWMEVLFPRQLDAGHVLGKWQPETSAETLGYYLWALVGLPLVLVGYPLLLIGYGTRFYAGKLDSAATRLGVIGVVLLSVVVWGALSVAASFQFGDAGQFSLAAEGFLAVLAASVVATVAAALAILFGRVGGRATSVLLAYPAAMTALFLPPVVAALFVPTLQQTIFPASEELAITILDEILFVGGLNEIIRNQFTLEGTGYVLMWLSLSVPLGWFLGGLVALADFIRPKDE
ncbi:hypothetical protein EGH24_00985 [Halonotius terrestris]|uniref:Uncharacterized protein n=1 Tax=Halonotius terrestris TaxID=2487750 RepID=A0A8J8TD12_9EURY|nr:hypothetical protein [Halonotius terrestris]TQQ83860.1 hypothetical protein EGH24_00985 [Halonotius terrestris]